MDSETSPVSEHVEQSSSRILGLLPMFLIFIVIILRMSWVLYRTTIWQKTRNTQQARRVYVPGTRQRQLSVQGEPTIYVSPSNLPPPPKYEAMAPPSYEEVMGVHYPAYQPGQQPIVQPLTHALAQGSAEPAAPSNVTITVTEHVTPAPAVTPAVVTITTEQRRPSVARS